MDNISSSILIIILILLILCSAYFSGTETAFMAINRFRIKHKAIKGDRQARRIMQLLQHPDRFLVLVLIGNNLVNILASAIATVLAIRYFGNYGVAVATFGLTAVVLMVGEITPKTIAALMPDQVARRSSIIIVGLMKILWPLVLALNILSKIIIRISGVKTDHIDNKGFSVDELQFVLSSEKSSIIPKTHKDLLLGVLNLSDITVEEIMVPRNDLYAVNINDDWKDIQKQVMNTPHTRVLFYRDELEDAVGFMHTRDALRILAKDSFSKENILRAIEEAYYIPENTTLLVQLQKFRRNKKRCGLVIDEFGDIQGLVTLDDILEEIVGDFTTSLEVDVGEEIERMKDGSFILEGQANIRDVNKELHWHIPTTGPVTINGIILEELGDNPHKDQTVNIGDYLAKIIETNESSVIKAQIWEKHVPNELFTEIKQEDISDK